MMFHPLRTRNQGHQRCRYHGLRRAPVVTPLQRWHPGTARATTPARSPNPATHRSGSLRTPSPPSRVRRLRRTAPVHNALSPGLAPPAASRDTEEPSRLRTVLPLSSTRPSHAQGNARTQTLRLRYPASPPAGSRERGESIGTPSHPGGVLALPLVFHCFAANRQNFRRSSPSLPNGPATRPSPAPPPSTFIWSPTRPNELPASPKTPTRRCSRLAVSVLIRLGRRQGPTGSARPSTSQRPHLRLAHPNVDSGTLSDAGT
jgi:hypothetical protein